MYCRRHPCHIKSLSGSVRTGKVQGSHPSFADVLPGLSAAWRAHATWGFRGLPGDGRISSATHAQTLNKVIHIYLQAAASPPDTTASSVHKRWLQRQHKLYEERLLELFMGETSPSLQVGLWGKESHHASKLLSRGRQPCNFSIQHRAIICGADRCAACCLGNGKGRGGQCFQARAVLLSAGEDPLQPSCSTRSHGCSDIRLPSISGHQVNLVTARLR